MNRHSRTLAGVVALVSVTALFAACASGGSRSAARFCATLAQQKQQFLKTYDNTTQPPLQAFVTGMASIGEIPVIFDRLDKVAPSDIEPDVAAVRDAFKKELDQMGGAASDPMGALASGLASALVSAGPFQRVQDYITANCSGSGSGSGPAAAPTTAPPTNEYGGTTSVKDQSDYTYTITYHLSYSNATKSVQYDTPGNASVLIPATGTISIENTTQGREAPLPDGTNLNVGALFPSASPICSVTPPPIALTSHCLVALIGGQIGGTSLAPGGSTTVDVSTFKMIADNGTPYPDGDTVIHAAEASADAIVSTLEKGPYAFVLYTQGGGAGGPGDYFARPSGTACSFDDQEGLFDYTDSVLAQGTGTNNTDTGPDCSQPGG